jgi:hypothetical protein
MSDQEDAAPVKRFVRDLILFDCLKIGPEREVFGVRIWLLDETDPWSPDKDLDLAMGIEETDSRTLGECIEDVMICFREIQSGRSPLDAVPDFEIAIDDAHIERRDGYLWLCGEDGLHDRDAARRQLLVYALSEMEGWALTLHGIWRFGGNYEISDAPDISNGLSKQSDGGRRIRASVMVKVMTDKRAKGSPKAIRNLQWGLDRLQDRAQRQATWRVRVESER